MALICECVSPTRLFHFKIYPLILHMILLNAGPQIRGLMDKSYARARALLQSHRSTLNVIAEALLQYETLTGAELAQLLRGEPLAHRIAGGAGGAAGSVIDHTPESYGSPAIPVKAPISVRDVDAAQ